MFYWRITLYLLWWLTINSVTWTHHLCAPGVWRWAGEAPPQTQTHPGRVGRGVGAGLLQQGNVSAPPGAAPPGVGLEVVALVLRWAAACACSRWRPCSPATTTQVEQPQVRRSGSIRRLYGAVFVSPDDGLWSRFSSRVPAPNAVELSDSEEDDAEPKNTENVERWVRERRTRKNLCS